jgi:hypothetical protein
MNNGVFIVGGAVAIGVGATLVMDIWAIFLQRVFKINAFNFCLLGRWLSFMQEGTFYHHKITAAEKRPAECAIGWTAHYLIGIAYAFVLVIPASGHWLAYPSLFPALALGAITLVFPFFMMQPALGLGIAAAKTPNPTQARIKSLVTHSVFGIGLYLSAVAFCSVTNGLV